MLDAGVRVVIDAMPVIVVRRTVPVCAIVHRCNIAAFSMISAIPAIVTVVSSVRSTFKRWPVKSVLHANWFIWVASMSLWFVQCLPIVVSVLVVMMMMVVVIWIE